MPAFRFFDFISIYATMAWYPAEMNISAFVNQQPGQVYVMTEGFAVSAPWIACKKKIELE